MSKAEVIQQLENEHLKTEVPDFRVGDTVKVHMRIIEGAKERIQMFQGTVIARKGSGLSETFSLHRIAYGEGMERVFPLHSPRIAKIEVIKHGKVRRAKLYYLRGTSGKAARVKGSVGVRTARPGIKVSPEKKVVDDKSEAVVEEATTSENTGESAAETSES